MPEQQPEAGADEAGADTGLTLLASTWMPHLVGARGTDLSVEVRPATTKEALSVLAAAERLRSVSGADGLADGWGTLESVASGWLPERLQQELFGGPIDIGEAVEAMLALLATGAEDEEDHAEREEAAREKARRFSWPTVLAGHARCFSMGYAEVLEQSWPLFLVMQEETDRIEARAQLREAEWYAAAKTNGMDSILERAQVEDTRPKEKTPWEAEGIAKEEYERRLRSRALRVQKQWMRKEAEA